MANIKRAERELNKLKRSMRSTIDKWNSPAGEPTVPDMASSIASWKSDMEKLGVHDELNSKSIHMAYRSITRAWQNRSNRKTAIRASEDAVLALEEVEDAKSVPEPVKSYQVQNARHLFGEDIGRYKYEPNVFGDLHEIHRQIQGFEYAGSSERIDYTNLVRVKSELTDITNRYPPGSKIHRQGMAAIKSLTVAQKSGGNSRNLRQYFSDAAAHVNNMGVHADVYHSPASYKAELVHARHDVLDAIKRAEDVMYQQGFEPVGTTIRNAIKAVAKIQDSMSGYYDPKAKRLIDTIEYDLTLALEGSKTPGVKSAGDYAWDHQLVIRPFEEAYNGLSELHAYIKTL